jgi:pimeloyl-ACP methyl ester carboxylesterase
VRVFLLHGLARTVASMAVLAHRLKKAGHRPSLFGYHVLFHSLDGIAERLRDRVARVTAEDLARAGGEPRPYAVIGHSLGGVVARMAAPELPPGLARLVLLASPARPPATARALRENPVFRAIARDAGQRLCAGDFFDALPRPEVPTLVIAGTRGPRSPRLLFRGELNDGIVRVSETRLDGAPLLLVHGVHTFLMNRRDVFEAIRQFLEPPLPPRPNAGGGGRGRGLPSSSRGRGC